MLQQSTVVNLERALVEVWYRKTADLSAEVVSDADRYLSEEEIVRRDRLHFPADRRDFAIAHDLLRRTLSRYSDVSPANWRFRADNYGKPSIDNPQQDLAHLSFSLSHLNGCVGCGVTFGKLLGIDIESSDRVTLPLEIASRYFANHEWLRLREYSEDLRRIRFIELWTLKEAFLKAVGLGFSGALDGPAFRFEPPDVIVFDPPPGVDSAAWHFAVWDLGSNTRLAAAVAGSCRPRF